MNNSNLLGQLTAPTTVGSGDLLGCWFFKLATIAALLCLVMGLVTELREELKHHKRRREYCDKYCKPNKQPVSAICTLGNANIKGDSRKLKSMGVGVGVSEKRTNLITGGTQKPRLPFRLVSTFRNFFCCFSFSAHKSKNAAKQPNRYYIEILRPIVAALFRRFFAFKLFFTNILN